MRSMTTRLREKLDPKWLFYQSQKVRVRLTGLIEAFERVAGSRPGPKPQINFRAERLEEIVRKTGRRLSLAITSSAAGCSSPLPA